MKSIKLSKLCVDGRFITSMLTNVSQSLLYSITVGIDFDVHMVVIDSFLLRLQDAVCHTRGMFKMILSPVVSQCLVFPKSTMTCHCTSFGRSREGDTCRITLTSGYNHLGGPSKDVGIPLSHPTIINRTG